MRCSFIYFIYLAFIVYAKKNSEDYTSLSNEGSFEVLPFAEGVLDFTGRIRRDFGLQAALIDPSKSMICSPLSVLIPLGKLVLGAGGKTKEELLAAVGITSTKQLEPLFSHLIANMRHLEGVQLDVVSRIYVSSESKLKSKFSKSIKHIFSSTCQKIDPYNPGKTADSINDWVAENTRNKIKRLVSKSDITTDTSMVLVNAVYFSGNWLNKFEKTFTDTFYSSTGRRRTPMMSRSGIYKYWLCETLNAQIVEIPYEGSKVSMIIVSPSSKRGLPKLLRAIKDSPQLLNEALEKMKQTNVQLTMPKFKIETDLDLTSLYKKIGVSSIFRSNADLSGIIDDEALVVSTAKHKAVIEVTERGTEAAAATAVVVGLISSAPEALIIVDVNRPFYFIIRMYQDQLFTGIFNGNNIYY